MVPALERITRRGLHCVAVVLLVLSMISVGWSLNRPWRPSWLYEQMEAAGWIQYRTLPKPFDPPRLSVLTRIPEKEGATMTWRSSDGERLTITAKVSPLFRPNKTAIGVIVQMDGVSSDRWMRGDAFLKGSREYDVEGHEMARALGAGFHPLAMGPIVLRAETAAIFGLSILTYELNAGR